jgi:hypothetical protein
MAAEADEGGRESEASHEVETQQEGDAGPVIDGLRESEIS